MVTVSHAAREPSFLFGRQARRSPQTPCDTGSSISSGRTTSNWSDLLPTQATTRTTDNSTFQSKRLQFRHFQRTIKRSFLAYFHSFLQCEDIFACLNFLFPISLQEKVRLHMAIIQFVRKNPLILRRCALFLAFDFVLVVCTFRLAECKTGHCWT